MFSQLSFCAVEIVVGMIAHIVDWWSITVLFVNTGWLVSLFLVVLITHYFHCMVLFVLFVTLDVKKERQHNQLIQSVENFKTDKLKRTNTQEKMVLPNAEGKVMDLSLPL